MIKFKIFRSLLSTYEARDCFTSGLFYHCLVYLYSQQQTISAEYVSNL